MKCPACAKTNPVASHEHCPRCGADLSDLRTILQAVVAHQAKAAAALGRQDWEGALHWARRSWRLFHNKNAARIAALACAALHRPNDTLAWAVRTETE